MIPLLMSTVPSTSWFDVNTVFQFAMLFSIKVNIFWATPTILAHSKIHKWGTMSHAFRESIHAMDKLVSLLQQFFRMALSIRSWSFVPLEFFLHPFCSFGNNSWQLKCLYITSENIPVNSFHISGRQAIVLKFPITVPLLFSFMMNTVIHVGTCPAFTHSCRYYLSLGCRPVTFLNQNHCTWSGSTVFQLGILAIARFNSFVVMITISCFGVSLSFSFTFFAHSESLLCSTGSDHNFLQNYIYIYTCNRT